MPGYVCVCVHPHVRVSVRARVCCVSVCARVCVLFADTYEAYVGARTVQVMHACVVVGGREHGTVQWRASPRPCDMFLPACVRVCMCVCSTEHCPGDSSVCVCLSVCMCCMCVCSTGH